MEADQRSSALSGNCHARLPAMQNLETVDILDLIYILGACRSVLEEYHIQWGARNPGTSADQDPNQ